MHCSSAHYLITRADAATVIASGFCRCSFVGTLCELSDQKCHMPDILVQIADCYQDCKCLLAALTCCQKQTAHGTSARLEVHSLRPRLGCLMKGCTPGHCQVAVLSNVINWDHVAWHQDSANKTAIMLLQGSMMQSYQTGKLAGV